MLAGLFMVTVLIACLMRPRWAARRRHQLGRASAEPARAPDPPLALFLVVIGSIYAGIATPTELASLGVIASLVLAAANRRLTWPVLETAIEGTMRTTAMILLIFVAAFYLNFVISAVGLAEEINAGVTGSASRRSRRCSPSWPSTSCSAASWRPWR